MTQETTSTCVATPAGNVAQLIERCEYAEAIAAERFFGSQADAYAEAISHGRSPRGMLELLEREVPAVCIDGTGNIEAVYIDASRLRNALSGLPRNASVHIRTGCATDPVVIEVDNGTTLATIEPLAVEGFDPLWPSIARQEWGE